MKLKKPITITIETAENAVRAAMLCDHAFTECRHPNFGKMRDGAVNGEIYSQINEALKAQGINFNTWLPPQPFTIAGRECEFNADGSVKLSCGTTISNEEIEEFKKRREEAKAPEFLYWRRAYASDVYRAKSPQETGEFFQSGQWFHSHGVSMSEFQADGGCKPITRAEAIAIVGRENIDK